MSILPGILSFCFYRVNKVLLNGVQRLYFRLAPGMSTKWRTLSGEGLKKPLSLPIVMTTGPRWNPHAIAAGVGPLTVKRTLRIDARTAQASAQSWTAVINAFPSLRTMGSLGTVSGGNDTIELPPGRYNVILRYYEWNRTPRLPAIEVDGKEVVAATDLAPTTNDFFNELKGRKGFYYLCLHYYISVILRYEKHLPASFVRREYLPIGNPETEFFYGAMKPGERLDLKPYQPLLRDHRVYATIYNRASFPVFWSCIDSSTQQVEPIKDAAYFLIRAHRRAVAESARA